MVVYVESGVAVAVVDGPHDVKTKDNGHGVDEESDVAIAVVLI